MIGPGSPFCPLCREYAHPITLDCNCLAPWWKRKSVIAKAPVLATVLLEYANIGQLWRMWSEHTAAGQSLWSWISVLLALLTYGHFYRVCLPEQKWAIRMNWIGIGMNVLVCLTVLYFRYL